MCQKPLIVKLSPNVSDIAAIAVAAEGAGADAISLINTLLAMKIDIRTRRPVLYNNTGGLSGPAIRPVAVRMVWQAAAAVKIPVIGMGGITCGEDAIEFILAGACAVGVGTATFSDPFCIIKVKNGIKDYLISNRCDKIEDIRGKLILNT
ncbi:Dihydroorotate dehydrogenase B (NAD(+)), catalytic subunit [bioreactor metagenome]|uniref:Dihydroorotate dehydrogenase B (NAD(+)), catalytic subunit n=1 Tax=bioreactor metagenome TaxID=1076179 RepID=A0A645GS91_9ZZZZ